MSLRNGGMPLAVDSGTANTATVHPNTPLRSTRRPNHLSIGALYHRPRSRLQRRAARCFVMGTRSPIARGQARRVMGRCSRARCSNAAMHHRSPFLLASGRRLAHRIREAPSHGPTGWERGSSRAARAVDRASSSSEEERTEAWEMSIVSPELMPSTEPGSRSALPSRR
jgi:hypothetical protein